MRIVAGELKGRTFVAPAGQDTRPTTDRVREAVFSTLFSELGGWAGVRVLDLYAGSGAFGFEALSRGAMRAVGVDDGKAAVRAITANAASLGVGERYTLVRGSVETSLGAIGAAGPFDLVYLDPPYSVEPTQVESVLGSLVGVGALADGAVIGYEHQRKTKPLWPAGFQQFRTKEYGYTAVSYAMYRDVATGDGSGAVVETQVGASSEMNHGISEGGEQ